MRSVLKKQDGQAVLLTVIVITTVLITSLISTYIYTANRLRYYAQIKEAYKIADATEAAAKTVKGAYDQAMAVYIAAGANTCPSGSVAPQCTPDELFAKVVLPTGGVCFTNVDSSTPYCFTPQTIAGENIEFKLKDKFQDHEFNRIERFASRLDKFFYGTVDGASTKNFGHAAKPLRNVAGLFFTKPGMFNWLINESRSLADGNSSIVIIANSSAPDCHAAPGAPGCALCNQNASSAPIQAGIGLQSLCQSFCACPLSWPGCTNSSCSIGSVSAQVMQQAFRIPVAGDTF